MELRINVYQKELLFNEFDSDKEMEVSIEDEYRDTLCVWLSPNQINEVITHLAKQLQSIGEPIDLLTELTIK